MKPSGKTRTSALAAFWQDRTGEGYVKICVLLFSLTLLFSVLVSCGELFFLVKNVRNSVEKALDGMAMKSAESSYSEENEGVNIGFSWDESTFYGYLSAYFPGVEQTADGYCCKDANGNSLWAISSPAVTEDGNGELTLKAEYLMTIPVRWAGMDFPDMHFSIQVESNRKIK